MLRRKQATALYDSPSSLSPPPPVNPLVIDLTNGPATVASSSSAGVAADDDSNSSLTNGVLVMLQQRQNPLPTAKRPQQQEQQQQTRSTNQLWVDEYRPQGVQDLAVHNKKVKQVREWLKMSLDALRQDTSRAPKLLVLTGPSGCGKTATVQAVAREMNCSVSEWINPVGFAYKLGDRGGESQMDAFASFISRSSQYTALPLFGDEEGGGTGKVILVEDAPFVVSERDQLERFRAVLRTFLRTGTFPLVFILCDAAEGTSSVDLILGDIRHSPLVTTIAFVPTNKTLLTKAMRGVLAASGYAKSVSEEQLEALAEDNGGDLRAAINGLQILCVGSKRGPATAPAKLKKKRKGATQDDFAVPRARVVVEDEDAVLSSRDSTLSIFHGLGKVFYPKRSAQTGRLLIDTESIVERMPIDLSLMHLFMHENYLNFYTDLDESATALDHLSLADLVLNASRADGNFYASLETSAAAISIRGFIQSLHHRPAKNSRTSFVRAKARDFDLIRASTKTTARALFGIPCDSAAAELRNEALDEVLPFCGKMALTRSGEPLSTYAAQLRSHFSASQLQFFYSLCSFNTRLVGTRSLGPLDGDESSDYHTRPGVAFEAANAALVGAHLGAAVGGSLDDADNDDPIVD